MVEPRANGHSPDATWANVRVLGQTWDAHPATRMGSPISPAIMASRPVPVDRHLPFPQFRAAVPDTLANLMVGSQLQKPRPLMASHQSSCATEATVTVPLTKGIVRKRRSCLCR